MGGKKKYIEMFSSFAEPFKYHTQESPRINPQDRQKITFHGSAYLNEILQQRTAATHRIGVSPGGGPPGVPPVHDTKCSWMYLGGGLPSPLMPVPTLKQCVANWVSM